MMQLYSAPPFMVAANLIAEIAKTGVLPDALPRQRMTDIDVVANDCEIWCKVLKSPKRRDDFSISETRSLAHNVRDAVHSRLKWGDVPGLVCGFVGSCPVMYVTDVVNSPACYVVKMAVMDLNGSNWQAHQYRYFHRS